MLHSKALAVTQHMLDRLLAVYGEPEVGDVQHFLREYMLQLMDFSGEELTEGCNIVLGTHKYKRWPFPSECKDACLMARDRIRRRRVAEEGPKSPAADRRVICFLRKGIDGLQWRAWMDRLAYANAADLQAQAEAAGEIATHSNFPREFEGLEGFVGCGPFEFDRKKEAHFTGFVTVHDGGGRQIR